jgi:redox-sensitive bicupin YhaK (pirin superfamily)
MPYGYTSRLFLSLGIFDENITVKYDVKIPDNGAYLFLIEGEIEINGETVRERDAYGIVEFDSFEIKTKNQSKILIIEVPMMFN